MKNILILFMCLFAIGLSAQKTQFKDSKSSRKGYSEVKWTVLKSKYGEVKTKTLDYDFIFKNDKYKDNYIRTKEGDMLKIGHDFELFFEDSSGQPTAYGGDIISAGQTVSISGGGNDISITTTTVTDNHDGTKTTNTSTKTINARDGSTSSTASTTTESLGDGNTIVIVVDK